MSNHAHITFMNQYNASMDTYFHTKINLITALTMEILMVYYFVVLWEYPAMSGHSYLIFKCLPTYKQ